MPDKKTPKKKTASVAAPLSKTEEFERLLKEAPQASHYVLRLFITGTTPRSMLAIANIRTLCEKHLPGQYELEVVDIYQQPAEAADEQIIAAPTLIKESPAPSRRMVGDFSDEQKVMIGLNLISHGEAAGAHKSDTKWIKL